ncbi:MAG: hypothetical protein CYPHOPRED_000273 [Cyphobasidiales sp. Tagirdzhanova-0007]|nr:MAG: hypothetical protein CYPHOPRED_000273 [Cyphobasidiales sp. Tagirdzhanova-0007]
MNNYNPYYQHSGTYKVDENMGRKNIYSIPSTSAQPYSPSPFAPINQSYQSYDYHTTPSEYSYTSSLMSPGSLRSSNSCGVHTPVTSPGLASPLYLKEESPSSSWFGAMQESYLANRQDPMSLLPPVPRMQRMSLSGTGALADPCHQSSDKTNLYHAEQEAPRRASVVTFQPTISRSSITPRRPSIQAGSHSEPTLTSHQLRDARATPRPRYAQRPHLQLNMPGQPLHFTAQQPTSAKESGEDVDKLFAEVFGSQADVPTMHISDNSKQNMHSPQAFEQRASAPLFSPVNVYQPHSQPQPEKHNFAGVLLQAEDFHMLETDPLSSSLEAMYSGHAAPHQSGWQSSFSLDSAAPFAPSQMRSQSANHPPAPLVGPSAQWISSRPHGYESSPSSAFEYARVVPERPASAPIAGEFFEELIPGTDSMNRRRGSSIDLAPLQPFVGASTYQPTSAYVQPVPLPCLSPAYLGPGPTFGPRGTLASRRSTTGPQPLSLVARSFQPYPLASKSDNLPFRKSSVCSPTLVPINRPSGRAAGSRRGSAASVPMFINFTSKDAGKLLTGVAPSGSSKRKREEEEQARQAKLVREGQEMVLDATA